MAARTRRSRGDRVGDQSLIAALLLVAGGCATGSAETGLRATLDTLADWIDPASQLAAESCVAREEASVIAAEAGRMTIAQAREELRVTRTRCHAMRDAFEAMRRQHDRARVFVERGEFDQARALVDAIRAELRQLDAPRKEGVP